MVCPSVESVRASVETSFGTLGVPVSLESRAALRSTAFGKALLSLLRFAWLGGERPELFAHLRSPYSGLPRRDVDWVEGKIRGRAVLRGECGRAHHPAPRRTVAADGRPRPGVGIALGAVRALRTAMLRYAHGTSARR